METNWNFDVSNLTDLESTERHWRELEEKSDCSFFQSWCWIGTWLEKIRPHFDPLLIRLTFRDEVIALAVVVPKRVLRRGCILSKGLHLGATGDSYYDSITVEYNGPLVKAGMHSEASAQIIRGLQAHRLGWNELYLSGLDHATRQTWKAAVRPRDLIFREKDRRPVFAADLAALHGLDDYLKMLSSNTRQQVRRALRGYERLGPIEVSEATSEGEARSYFSELRRLHQCYWNDKGQQGAFGSDFQNEFHNLLIERTFSSGRLQMLRFRAGDFEVGYLYNFAWRGVVYSYQSGFVYSESDPRLKPGLVCHSLAVDWNRKKDMHVYDFLAGDSRYKKSLSTEQGEMYWAVLQKAKWRFVLENLLGRARGSLLGNVRP